MRTKGRKSALKKFVPLPINPEVLLISLRKTKETGLSDSDGNSVDLTDVEKDGDDEVTPENLEDLQAEAEHKVERKAEVQDGMACEPDARPKKTRRKSTKKEAVKGSEQDLIAAEPQTGGSTQVPQSSETPSRKELRAPRKSKGRKVDEELPAGNAGEKISRVPTSPVVVVKKGSGRKSMTKQIVKDIMSQPNTEADMATDTAIPIGMDTHDAERAAEEPIEGVLDDALQEVHEEIEKTEELKPSYVGRGRRAKRKITV